MLSALAHPQPVTSYLDTELQAGRVIGPLAPDTAKLVQVTLFGVIPKANQPGKRRLILDLLHPEEASINSGIKPELCSLQYAKVDQAVE